MSAVSGVYRFRVLVHIPATFRALTLHTCCYCYPIARRVRALVATRYGMGCVAAGRRTRRLPLGCVAAGRRPTTHNRAETVRQRPLGVHLVQAPGLPVDTLERVTPKYETRR